VYTVVPAPFLTIPAGALNFGRPSRGSPSICPSRAFRHTMGENGRDVVNVNVGVLGERIIHVVAPRVAPPQAAPRPCRRCPHLGNRGAGHVDSGKTSLVAALSTQLSTAALDKHPESRRRGITQDLGFSSFVTEAPAHLARAGTRLVQYTLVDCPGHASLIRTIIGGAQIMDVMVLVVDATEGIQTQTAECIVVGELTARQVVVVLNKTDLLPGAEGDAKLAKLEAKVQAVLSKTRFKGATVVRAAARPGGGSNAEGFDGSQAKGVAAVVGALRAATPELSRRSDGPFCFAVDHCFPIKGQGTVLTGTVLSGEVNVGSEVEDPGRRERFRVKSMQMFKRPVQQAGTGDRVGLCVAGLSPDRMERGLMCAPGAVPTFSAAVAAVERIRYFRGDVRSKARMHVTVGHLTTMAEMTFFGDDAVPSKDLVSLGGGAPELGPGPYQYQDRLRGAGEGEGDALRPGQQWVLLTFDRPVTAPRDVLVIGSKFDTEVHTPTCRLAWYGRLVRTLDVADRGALEGLRVYKCKERTGVVERVKDDGRSAVCREMFKKETDLSLFQGMTVSSRVGPGRIEGSFGKSGKFTVAFSADGIQPGDEIVLRFRKYVFAHDRKAMRQD